MTWPKIFLRALLLFVNLHLYGKRTNQLHEKQNIYREFQREERKKKLRKKTYPVKRQRFLRRKIHGKYTSTKPKDHRFSDQKKLRRMYRNM